MDISILQEYTIIPVVVGCLCTGYCLKHFTQFLNNAIPSMMAVLGIVLAILINLNNLGDIPSITLIAIQGALSGLASTGLHQMLKDFIERGGKDGSN